MFCVPQREALSASDISCPVTADVILTSQQHLLLLLAELKL